ncbi:hypothetical protein [Kitasatospora sp. NPDC056531]|uniref:hypothetical protein n=1 Tax=Kitasatospora sp. NPDC056531 TaxID=3345856 RepID=UPI003676C273
MPLGALLGGLAADVLGGAMGPETGTGWALVLAGLASAASTAVLLRSELRSVREIPGAASGTAAAA